MTNPLRKLWRAGAPSLSTPKQDVATRPVGNEVLVNDRRAAKRHFYPLPAMLRCGSGAAEERVGIYNFSEKGLCFRSEIRFPIGASVEITAKMPAKPLLDGRTVRYLARVKRVTLERGQFTVGAVIERCETLSERLDTAPKNSKQQSKARQQALDRKAKSGSLRAAKQNGAAKEKPEYRQFSRYGCATQAQFRTPGDGVIMSGEVANLSLGGCYLRTAEALPLGASLELVLQVDKNRIYTQGRVTVVDEKQGIGVEFESNLRDCLRRLPRFVKVVSSSQQARDQRKK